MDLPVTGTVDTSVDPAWRISDEVVLEPGGVLARELDKGQRLRITDVQGRQVGDLVAFNRADLGEKFWISNTVRLNGTVYLTAGHVLYSELSKPMLSIVSDSCGRHDLLAGSCNAEIDKVRYGVDDHRGCVENFVAALQPWGIERVDIPMSFNVFMNCPVEPDGAWSIAVPTSEPGDHIEFVAEMDLVVSISNCPQDKNACNAGELKPLRIAIYDPAQSTG